jgi:hypothetical protein
MRCVLLDSASAHDVGLDSEKHLDGLRIYCGKSQLTLKIPGKKSNVFTISFCAR